VAAYSALLMNITKGEGNVLFGKKKCRTADGGRFREVKYEPKVVDRS